MIAILICFIMRSVRNPCRLKSRKEPHGSVSFSLCLLNEPFRLGSTFVLILPLCMPSRSNLGLPLAQLVSLIRPVRLSRWVGSLIRFFDGCIFRSVLAHVCFSMGASLEMGWLKWARLGTTRFVSSLFLKLFAFPAHMYQCTPLRFRAT